MFFIDIIFPNNKFAHCTSKASTILIGNDSACKLTLSGLGLGQRHAELFVHEECVFLRDLGTPWGTSVNHVPINGSVALLVGDVITIAGHAIKARWIRQAPQRTIHRPDRVKGHIEPYVSDAVILGHACFQAGASDKAPLGADLSDQSYPTNAPSLLPKEPNLHTSPLPQCQENKNPQPAQAEHFRYRKLLQDRLVQSFALRRTDVHHMGDAELRELTESIITDLLLDLPELSPNIDRLRLLAEVRDESVGLGLLEPLLEDPTVSEIMVNAADEIFVERKGKIERIRAAFTSNQAVLGIIERIVAPVGRRIDESSPMVDARLRDGSRVNAIIPPLALKGPCLTIRKFSMRKFAAHDLLHMGSVSLGMIDFLKVCVEQKKNIIISGGTGSGKTTLLNMLSNFIPPDERIVTIEDAAELHLQHANQVGMEARPPNIEGKGQVTIRELVKNALRMRPDRIVVGECRGGEALDMLQAMNTGHDGSITTAHANTPRDLLSRLEVMVMMAGMDLPLIAIREQVAAAVHVIVQQSRLVCGARKVTSIVELTGIESGTIQLQEIFAFVQDGLNAEGKTEGYFTGRGFAPEFYEQLAARGLPIDMGIFSTRLCSNNNQTHLAEI